MRPYGIVVFPEQGAIRYGARRVEDGLVAQAHDDEDVQAGITHPIAVFYETEHGRDLEMEELLRIYPGVMFCPVTLTSGKKTQPNPKATEFTISNRGVLPA